MLSQSIVGQARPPCDLFAQSSQPDCQIAFCTAYIDVQPVCSIQPDVAGGGQPPHGFSDSDEVIFSRAGGCSKSHVFVPSFAKYLLLLSPPDRAGLSPHGHPGTTAANRCW